MGEPCKGLLDLNRANDWHLCLCLTLLKTLVGEGLVEEHKITEYMKQAIKEVTETKMKLVLGLEHSELPTEEGIVKLVTFHNA
jgi:hypothetical protein